MLEIAISLVLVLALTTPFLLIHFLSLSKIVWLCLFAMGAGLALGVPGGILYHIRLYQALVRDLGTAPKRWWLNPTSHHHRLKSRESMMPSFVIGAAGFTLVVYAALVMAVTLSSR